MGLIYPLAVKDAVPCIAPGGAELIRDRCLDRISALCDNSIRDR